jgi:hypothetical protein
MEPWEQRNILNRALPMAIFKEDPSLSDAYLSSIGKGRQACFCRSQHRGQLARQSCLLDNPMPRSATPCQGTKSVQIQNDLADIALLVKGILGGVDLLKLIGFSDQRRDVAAFDPLDKIAEDIWSQYRATEEA